MARIVGARAAKAAHQILVFCFPDIVISLTSSLNRAAYRNCRDLVDERKPRRSSHVITTRSPMPVLTAAASHRQVDRVGRAGGEDAGVAGLDRDVATGARIAAAVTPVVELVKHQLQHGLAVPQYQPHHAKDDQEGDGWPAVVPGRCNQALAHDPWFSIP